jgi:peptidoglycan hydrolase-like protein with peptidoglycan-binding domain
MDYDVPHATGDLDPKTKAAIATFQKTIGASPTGILTAKQLQALFVKAAERQAQSK